jgi:hypothetical protein
VNRVRLGFFSLSGSGPSGDDGPYLAWHLYDHLPEQYQIGGIVQGQRWITSSACLAARSRAADSWGTVRHVVQYLMGEPVEETLEEFYDLARQLDALGRMRPRPPSRFQCGLPLLGAQASPRVLVSPEVVPFRPNLGIYLVLEEITDRGTIGEHMRWMHEEHLPAVLAAPGVAGMWLFGTTGDYEHERFARGNFRLSVCYLDGEPAQVAPDLARLWERAWDRGPLRPLLAAPFESVISHDWDRFGSVPP